MVTLSYNTLKEVFLKSNVPLLMIISMFSIQLIILELKVEAFPNFPFEFREF